GFSASTATLPDSAATIVLFQSGIICAEAVLWGSQSWLQPAFQPAFAEYEGCAAEPPERRLQAGLPAPHLFSSRETPPCASDSGTDDRVLSPVTRQAYARHDRPRKAMVCPTRFCDHGMACPLPTNCASFCPPICRFARNVSPERPGIS